MDTAPGDELIIVYNADSGAFGALADALHKVLSPATYPCSLCAVTYGAVSMRGPWRAFLGSLPQRKRFFHRDDFAAAFPQAAIALPAILVRHGGGDPVVLVSAAELDDAADLSALIALVRARLG